METTEIISEPRRLTRPREDRWLGGVAAGLGAYFDLSPTIYRIAFVALGLAGGTGVLLYIAAWLVIPEDGAADSIAGVELKKHRDRPRRMIGLAILGFAAVVALSSAHVWPSPGNLWLALVVGIAALAWWRLGPASSRRRRVVVAGSVVGVVAVLLAAVLLAVRVPLFAGIGDRTNTPVDAANVHSKYELGIGDLTLNFANVSLPKGQTFVKATVGIGDLKVIVPANASVDVQGRAQGGDVRLFGEKDSGTHVRAHVVDRTGSGRVLVLDIRTGLGRVQVLRG
jgi:phage shock protein PspC (stress-responsive transcriptional regulator)